MIACAYTTAIRGVPASVKLTPSFGITILPNDDLFINLHFHVNVSSNFEIHIWTTSVGSHVPWKDRYLYNCPLC